MKFIVNAASLLYGLHLISATASDPPSPNDNKGTCCGCFCAGFQGFIAGSKSHPGAISGVGAGAKLVGHSTAAAADGKIDQHEAMQIGEDAVQLTGAFSNAVQAAGEEVHEYRMEHAVDEADTPIQTDTNPKSKKSKSSVQKAEPAQPSKKKSLDKKTKKVPKKSAEGSKD